MHKFMHSSCDAVAQRWWRYMRSVSIFMQLRIYFHSLISEAIWEATFYSELEKRQFLIGWNRQFLYTIKMPREETRLSLPRCIMRIWRIEWMYIKIKRESFTFFSKNEKQSGDGKASPDKMSDESLCFALSQQ